MFFTRTHKKAMKWTAGLHLVVGLFYVVTGWNGFNEVGANFMMGFIVFDWFSSSALYLFGLIPDVDTWTVFSPVWQLLTKCYIALILLIGGTIQWCLLVSGVYWLVVKANE